MEVAKYFLHTYSKSANGKLIFMGKIEEGSIEAGNVIRVLTNEGQLDLKILRHHIVFGMSDQKKMKTFPSDKEVKGDSILELDITPEEILQEVKLKNLNTARNVYAIKNPS